MLNTLDHELQRHHQCYATAMNQTFLLNGLMEKHQMLHFYRERGDSHLIGCVDIDAILDVVKSLFQVT